MAEIFQKIVSFSEPVEISPPVEPADSPAITGKIIYIGRNVSPPPRCSLSLSPEEMKEYKKIASDDDRNILPVPVIWHKTPHGVRIASLSEYGIDTQNHSARLVFEDMNGDGLVDIRIVLTPIAGGMAIFNNAAHGARHYAIYQVPSPIELPGGKKELSIFSSLINTVSSSCNGHDLAEHSLNDLMEIARRLAAADLDDAARFANEVTQLLSAAIHAANGDAVSISRSIHYLKHIVTRLIDIKRPDLLIPVPFELDIGPDRSITISKYNVEPEYLLEGLARLAYFVKDDDNFVKCLEILRFFIFREGMNTNLYGRFIITLIEVEKKSELPGLAAILAGLYQMVKEDKKIDTVKIFYRLSVIADKTSSSEQLKEILKMFGFSAELDLETFKKYGFILTSKYPPSYDDIIYAEKTIGAENARLLYEKFHITYFKRYHESVLAHLVKMADDPGYMHDSPLVLAVTAKDDPNGAFYWGRRFEYDPRVRMVVIEVGSEDEFFDYIEEAVEKYGVPDTMLITGHGDPEGIHLSPVREGPIDQKSLTIGDKEDFIARLRGIFGKKPPQVVLNSCSTGKKTGDDKYNMAQMIADALITEVIAPEDDEALLGLKINFDEKTGRARLYPTYFEIKWGPFGVLNIGGTRYLPKNP